MGKHTAGPRDWTPTRITEENLVRHYGFKAPAPVLRVEQPVTTRRMHPSEEAASGLADIVIGTVALVASLVLLIVRGISWIVRAIRRRT